MRTPEGVNTPPTAEAGEVGRTVLKSIHEERTSLPCARQQANAEALSEFHHSAPPTMAG